MRLFSFAREGLGHTIQPVHVICMDELVIYQPSPVWICGHVFQLFLKIFRITNAMLVEAGLPDISRELLPNRERETALNTLNAPLRGLPLSRRQHDMQMFRHDRKPVQQEPPLFSISEHGFHQQLGVRGSYKEGSPLKRHGGDGVGIDGEPRIWVQRSIPQGLTGGGKTQC